ncbi:MAG: hypothetical protein HOP13_19035, partial [Alphaproteobacteria bacterium]|nr:hypothetical protein [Alphaproteobacteria bacterium]
MLLRDTNASDFRVPTAPRPQIAIDSANAKADRIAADALNRRDERDARLAAAHERARARLHFVKTFADEGQQSKGLVARMDEALKTYKSSAGALDGEAFAALAREVRAEALRIEAMAHARDRVLQTGKTLDRLIEATGAAPQNFEAHAEAAREAVEGQQLPA